MKNQPDPYLLSRAESARTSVRYHLKHWTKSLTVKGRQVVFREDLRETWSLEKAGGGIFSKRKGALRSALWSCLAGFGHLFPGLVPPPRAAWRPRLKKIHPNIFMPVDERDKNAIHFEFLLHHGTDECKIGILADPMFAVVFGLDVKRHCVPSPLGWS